jgi:hypothetical protein
VSDAIAALQCRDDILQAMYWLRGEGLGDEATVTQLTVFLVVEEALLREQLAVLTADGLLIGEQDRYRLSERGVQEGGRLFFDEFNDLLKTAHGECPPNCPYCRDTRGADCPHCQAVA